MHNTPLANAEFQLTFCETNLRWLLGDEPRDEAKIDYTQSEITRLKEHVNTLKKNP
jgi:hypothetical protein